MNVFDTVMSIAPNCAWSRDTISKTPITIRATSSHHIAPKLKPRPRTSTHQMTPAHSTATVIW